MDDEPVDANEPLDYTLIGKEESLEQRAKPKSKKKKGGLDSKIPTDIGLFVSGTGTFVTGLLMKRNRRRYCDLHHKFAYATAGFATLHLYQHRKVVIGYAKKKYRNAKKRIDELIRKD